MHIDWTEFNWKWFDNIPVQKRKRGNQRSTQKYYYKDLITAFDIETTYIKEIDQSVMYIWQWQFGDKCTVIGRTWQDLRYFMEKLEDYLTHNGDVQRLVIFVHNLSFEFQYLSGIFDFDPEGIFAVDRRQVLRVLHHDIFEYRCSYLQTNMSLRQFCEKMGVRNYKLKMNYKKRRYWYTELTPKEIAYCINDVKGLVQAISTEMERDGDNLYTLPYTSTGYARRDARAAMRYVSPNYIKSQIPTIEIYHLLREAFRGGNTHANRYYSDKKLTSEIQGLIHSVDVASMYPDSLCNDLYPITKFQIKKEATKKDLEELIYKRHKAVLVRCELSNVELIDEFVTVPYLAVSKCTENHKHILGGVYDNGRIISADLIEQVTLTDIDYEILKKQYKFDIKVITLASARYGKLPPSLIDCIKKYFINKTEFKDRDSDTEHTSEYYEIIYQKMKALLNAQYGMMAQNPVKVDIKYNTNKKDLFYPDPEADEEYLLNKYYENAFLVYQWGVFCTAHCRAKLQRGIDACGMGFIYCDTDSCKYVGNVDFSKLNKEYEARSKKNGCYATDKHGVVHYMGVFEQEKDMLEFKTMGAKKYAFRDLKGKLHITIAGVNKKIGAIELERDAAKATKEDKSGHIYTGLDMMVKGKVFKYAGGLEARYKDFPEVREWITEDGVPIRITRNVSLVENTKTLGLNGEYEALLLQCQKLRFAK